jgi:hypothetical protein
MRWSRCDCVEMDSLACLHGMDRTLLPLVVVGIRSSIHFNAFTRTLPTRLISRSLSPLDSLTLASSPLSPFFLALHRELYPGHPHRHPRRSLRQDPRRRRRWPILRSRDRPDHHPSRRRKRCLQAHRRTRLHPLHPGRLSRHQVVQGRRRYPPHRLSQSRRSRQRLRHQVQLR